MKTYPRNSSRQSCRQEKTLVVHPWFYIPYKYTLIFLIILSKLKDKNNTFNDEFKLESRRINLIGTKINFYLTYNKCEVYNLFRITRKKLKLAMNFVTKLLVANKKF